MATTMQSLTLPEVPPKRADMRKARYPNTIVFDENSESKFYARCATTHASGAWVRRYKSINESQTFSNLLREQYNKDKIILRKHSYRQSLAASSPMSSPNSALVKGKRNRS